MTVASAVQPFRSRSMRTRSSNSRGKLERKIACSEPPNSTTVASFNLVFPARSAVICTGTRTGLARGKKRANLSAHPCSFAMTVASLIRLTSPLSRLRFQNRASFAVWHTCFRKWAERPRDRDARCTPKEWKGDWLRNRRNRKTYYFHRSLAWLTRLTLKRCSLSSMPLLRHSARGETLLQRLSRLLCGVFYVVRTGAKRNVVSLQFTVKRRPANPQHPPRERFVSIGLLKHTQYGHPLHFR